VDCVANRVLEAVAAGVPDMPRRRWLWPFACLWSVGHRINLATKQPRALSTRVVSVGGLTMGGSGKTPLVAHLAERLEGAAILTRGYRRQDASAAVIVPRGTSALLARTGDEAQLYIRRAVAHVGISANRYEAGRQMEAQLKPSLFLLDDGFQHTELKRACDIVVIDVENPWGGGLFPVGQRREPLSALARATAIVLTRIPKGAATTGIERAIKVHTSAPIFRTRMVPEPLSCATAAAFCGIGSPAAFWGTLAELSVAVVHRRAFPDHHRYRVAELEAFAREALSQGATILLTTEKDLMNLPANLTLPLPIQAVRIHMEIENEAELLRLVRGSA
jgi:tetraacyldisaccharide 4'-kinase